MVEIRHEFKEFHLPGSEGYNSTTNILSYGLGRYVEECRIAYIDSSSWPILTGDSIWYLNHNCNPKYTWHTGERYEQLIQSDFNIADSYSWQLKEWFKESLKNCLVLCREY